MGGGGGVDSPAPPHWSSCRGGDRIAVPEGVTGLGQWGERRVVAAMRRVASPLGYSHTADSGWFRCGRFGFGGASRAWRGWRGGEEEE